MANTKYTAFRCPMDLLEMAKARARRERRSLSNYLIMLIEKDSTEPAEKRAEGTRAPAGVKAKTEFKT
jgi:hypothetical protein